MLCVSTFILMGTSERGARSHAEPELGLQAFCVEVSSRLLLKWSDRSIFEV